jgi:hypothetical protein
MIDPGPLAAYLGDEGKVRGVEGQGWAFVYQNLLSVKATLDWIATNDRIRRPLEGDGGWAFFGLASSLEATIPRGGLTKAQLGEAALIGWQRLTERRR